MLVISKGAAIVGLDAVTIDVEVQVYPGKGDFTIIGLGDSAVKESRDRVKSAVRGVGFNISESHALINLAPADLKKEGSGFDLPIAVAILATSGLVRSDKIKGITFVGELALDGKIKGVKGTLAATIAAKKAGCRMIIIPKANALEAGLVSGITVIPAETLAQVCAFLRGEINIAAATFDPLAINASETTKRTISDVWGQETAKRALLIAATGGHNLIMIGPPGCGKSMLAECYSQLLPPLNEEEIMEVIKIHSIAGQNVRGFLSGIRPYRAPHHVVSDVGLIGGGSNPRPGEISLAHHGVLFLDEFPEFRRSAIEALRAPLENGKVSIVRSKGILDLPAKFQLLAAMNPCPCGRLGSQGCCCSQVSVSSYLKRLSQPILDRIDMHVELQPVPLKLLGREKDTNELKEIQERVRNGRAVQYRRQSKLNAYTDVKPLLNGMRLDDKAEKLLEQSSNRIGLSARVYTRILRVARTIADLEDSEHVSLNHLAEAISFRVLERLGGYLRAA